MEKYAKEPIYYEKCNKTTMSYYPFFMDKLMQIQRLSQKIYPKNIGGTNIVLLSSEDSINIKKDCIQCVTKKFYKLGNIIWSSNIKHKIELHKSYPSEYFVMVILNTSIFNNNIINPPIELKEHQIKLFTYIPLHYNKLLIIDALMQQGSHPRYLTLNRINNKEKFIYSEHSGVISIKNRLVDNIIVSAETDRTDDTDENIFLPINSKILAKHEYLFHTHPNTKTYAGRISDGIIYEFPSANDVLNFIKYHDEGLAQASLIIAPEGAYVIRPIYYQKKYEINLELFYFLKKFILKLEKMAIKKFKPIITKISDPNTFHKFVGSDFTWIKMYNRFIETSNLFIEFYPREKKNNEWCLRQINLPYIESD